jgi:hypothetical protein
MVCADTFYEEDMALAARMVVSGVIREEGGVCRPLGGAHGALSVLPQGDHPSLHVVINKCQLELPPGETPTSNVLRRLELDDNENTNISRQVSPLCLLSRTSRGRERD